MYTVNNRHKIMRKRKKQLLKFGTCVAGVAAIATIAAMIVGLAAYVGCRFIFECNCSEWPLVLGCHRSFDDFDVHVDVSKRVKLFPSEDTFFFEETAPRPGNVIRRVSKKILSLSKRKNISFYNLTILLSLCNSILLPN